MFLANVIHGSYSDKGIRKENQDAHFFLIKDKIAVLAVADGMGGYSLGREVALAIVDAVKRELNLCDNFSIEYLKLLINKKYIQVNDYLYDKYRSKSILTGSTLSTLCFVEDKFLSVNVGDTKICRIRNNEIITISKIHNVAAEQYEKGIISYLEYKNNSKKNVLTQCIGIGKSINPHFSIDNFHKGDYYFICSDGVYNHIDDDDFLDAFLGKKIHTNEDMEMVCKDIVLKAYSNGSKDNMTIVAFKII
ncbi:serine/threonine protein phosphatase [Clostridium polyendosporum]|uniref:Serine/threonine protein phosphatase n=1 Tax=Clostridium polyendosporum TaxID=69208 RepID=A0A919VHP6_9CLOT|nr:PP2C family serine/threonine-protein phosphatase [Clostridium polyendosporum]GIM30467.1 serine/threonine protein phosphatase [Clostridium polyendosporum]